MLSAKAIGRLEGMAVARTERERTKRCGECGTKGCPIQVEYRLREEQEVGQWHTAVIHSGGHRALLARCR